MTAYFKTRPRAAKHDQYGLTYHERRVVELLVSCRRLRDIATELGTSYRSVKAMAHSAYRKIGVAGQLELIAKMRPAPEKTEGADHAPAGVAA